MYASWAALRPAINAGAKNAPYEILLLYRNGYAEVLTVNRSQPGRGEHRMTLASLQTFMERVLSRYRAL
jgi:hypothetical protein